MLYLWDWILEAEQVANYLVWEIIMLQAALVPMFASMLCIEILAILIVLTLMRAQTIGRSVYAFIGCFACGAFQNACAIAYLMKAPAPSFVDGMSLVFGLLGILLFTFGCDDRRGVRVGVFRWCLMVGAIVGLFFCTAYILGGLSRPPTIAIVSAIMLASLGYAWKTLSPDARSFSALERIARHCIFAALILGIGVYILLYIAENVPDAARVLANIRLSFTVAFNILVIFSALILTIDDHVSATLRLADTDPLTQLLNRRGLERWLTTPRTGILLFDVVICDLDHFKDVNDRRGHDVGDAVLRSFAKALTDHMPHGTIVGRLGGEEFAAFMLAAENPRLQLEQTRLAIKEAMAIAHPDLNITASYGIMPGGNLADGMGANLAKADSALYRAKEHGRDRVEIFAPELPSDDGPQLPFSPEKPVRLPRRSRSSSS
jgi:diguanylate cyclase (GGDEF)-like protein